MTQKSFRLNPVSKERNYGKQAIEITASLMCCNPLILGDEIRMLCDAGCDGLHIDIMDGFFVKNFAMNIRDICHIRKITSLPITAHLMIYEPSSYLTALAAAGADRVIIHPESCQETLVVLETLHSLGVKAGIALSPATPLSNLTTRSLSLIDTVLMMAVKPGFSGQPYLPETADKITQIRQILKMHLAPHVLIEVDGAVSVQTVPDLYDRGARKFVAGSSGLFLEGKSYTQALRELKTSISYSRVG
jgi:ribulose-phosphate 3-epimerase